MSIELKCQHENAEVQAPCCSSISSSGYIECGCGGLYSVYCPDCRNKDMEDEQVEAILAKKDVEVDGDEI